MTDNQGATHPAQGEDAAAPASTLLDINAETYPFELVQHLLDEAAFFNLYSITDQRSAQTLLAPGGSKDVIGFKLDDALYRFDVCVYPPSERNGLRATNIVGEQVGRFTQRWMIIPDSFVALPGQEPPPTVLDVRRSQRFVMLDGTCTFGHDHDGFHGFGTGLTFPVSVDGQSQLAAAAVGTVVEGFGKFRQRDGTYTYCGSLSAESGFRGSLLCRVTDPQQTLGTDKAIPAPEAGPELEPGISYIMFRGQKKDHTQKTTYSFGSNGEIDGLNVSQQLRLFDVNATARGRGGIRSSSAIGQVIGRMTARIAFNLLNPGAPGTAVAPIPFQSYNTYTFIDPSGNVLGSFGADGGEGRTFNLSLSGAPGQRALRFGGFGPIENGTGRFAGIEGLMTDNSVVGIAPHALSTLYVLRIKDPEGKYRAAINDARR